MTVDAASLRARAGVGIGLRVQHVEEMIAAHPAIAWLEVHAENYMERGAARRALEQIRRGRHR